MLEAIIPLGVASITGISVMFGKSFNRAQELDNRIDRLELNIAQTYLSKVEFTVALERVEAHIIRIDEKLDRLVSK